jgi:hypothetical protein
MNLYLTTKSIAKANTNLMGQHESKTLPAQPVRRWEDNIKIDIEEK